MFCLHLINQGDSFQFPIGATSYNPVTIVSAGFTPQTFYTQVADSFRVPPALAETVLQRQWEIGKTGLGDIGVTLTFQWEEDDPAGAQFNPAAGVAIGYYDASQSKWIETTATYDPGPPRSATASFTRLIGGTFVIGNLGGVTSVTDEETPRGFALSQNYPNPFNPSTTMRYAIPAASLVTLKIYNLLGDEIETLVNKRQPAGEYAIHWNPVGLASGLYFYRLQVGGFVAAKKLMLLR